MRKASKRQGLVILLLLTYCRSADGETLSGTIVDPQQRAIKGAQVSLTCANKRETRTTDGEGLFAFAGQAFDKDCKIRAFYAGFAILEITIGQKRIWTLELRLADVKETVFAKDESLPQRSLTSVSLSTAELRKISDNSEVLIRYAKQLAGVSAGSDHLYVDGMLADYPPPAERIESITVNVDPFSAEYSDGSITHVEILTKPAEREFRLTAGGFSVGPGERDGMNPRLTSAKRTADFGLTGPVPYTTIAFTSDAHFTDRRTEVPIEAVFPKVQGLPIAAVDAAPTTNVSGSFGFGADYSRRDTLRMNASLYLWTVKQTNVNVSGVTLPEAGASQFAAVRELRATFRKIGAHFLYRGGLVADWFADNLRANTGNVGISVAGAFIAGGAQINKENSQGSKWTFKNVLEFDPARRHWSTGASVSRMEDERAISPNPVGYIQFDNLQDYIASATAGAHTGTALLTRGNGNVQYVSYAAAPFAEGEILHRSRLSVRGGVRADYQTGGGLMLSPRLSAVSVLSRFVLRAGSGIFVHHWRNDIFLRVMENDGHHLQQFLMPNSSLGDVQAGTAAIEPEIMPKVAPDFSPLREWMSKVSVERPFKNFVPGIEYTWTDSSHLLGSERLNTMAGWTDLLESNRALRKQLLHIRAQCRFAGQSLTAHYELIRSFDDTDGPFSFPAISGDLRDEWARSTGVSPHNFTLVGNFQMRGSVSVNVVGSWRSSAPYNITTGLDPAHNGLYTDRGGLARNSGAGPAYRNISLYAFRRFHIAGFAKESKHSLHANLGLQAENLLGNRNYVAFDSVRGSPIFGQPLSALSGRSLRLSFNLSQ